jgi:hypothetical protein
VQEPELIVLDGNRRLAAAQLGGIEVAVHSVMSKK